MKPKIKTVTIQKKGKVIHDVLETTANHLIKTKGFELVEMPREQDAQDSEVLEKIKLIKNKTSISILTAMLDQETNVQVLAEIQARLNKLEKKQKNIKEPIKNN